MRALNKLRQHFDWPLFSLIMVLIAVGLFNLHSATSSTKMTLLRQQMVWVVVGLVVFLVTAAIDYRVYYRWAYPLYGIGIIGLTIVLIAGRSVNKAQRWLEIAGMSGGQPSEIMKVLLILALAKYIHDDPVVEGRNIKHLAIPFLIVALPVILVLKQPDLGTAMLISFLFFSVMLLTKLRLRSAMVLLFIAIVSFPLTWSYLLHDYQKRRIYTFLEPGSDPGGAGWQARQSLYAVGSGGWFGKGYMKGTQNQLHFLPERWTDFPFAVWAEEWGFVGSTALLVLYLAIILWAVKLASEARDRFGAVLCMGVASLFLLHTVINLGMVSGVFPVVGVTLPLFSYGGSSILTMMCAAGLLMNVAIRKSSF